VVHARGAGLIASCPRHSRIQVGGPLLRQCADNVAQDARDDLAPATVGTQESSTLSALVRDTVLGEAARWEAGRLGASFKLMHYRVGYLVRSHHSSDTGNGW
jgi:hypothetical protein